DVEHVRIQPLRTADNLIARLLEPFRPVGNTNQSAQGHPSDHELSARKVAVALTAGFLLVLSNGSHLECRRLLWRRRLAANNHRRQSAETGRCNKRAECEQILWQPMSSQNHMF